MKTVEIQVYKISELSEKSKEKAFYNWLQYSDFPWGSDYMESLKAFLMHFNLSLKNYRLGGPGSFISTDLLNLDDAILDLTGNRLLSYLENNYFKYIRKGKFLTRGGVIGVGTKSKHSKISFTYDLTGFCGDHPFMNRDLRAIYKMTLREYIGDCLETFQTDYENDCDYYSSEECFIEEMESNEVEFHKNGSIY